MRTVTDILLFRADISPFLAHLTRTFEGVGASARLEQVLSQRQLRPGPSRVSDARFGGNTVDMSPAELQRFFGAVCFTDTPLSEVHCLLEIEGRAVNLEPYGLVFLRDRLKARRVTPVMYLNNETGDIDAAMYALFGLKDLAPDAAERILPLLAVFGQKIRPPGAAARPPGRVDFTWEREWRYPAALGSFTFTVDDVFCGVCVHDQVELFERQYAPLRFIDPRRNMKWYAQSLIASRQRLDLEYSVV